MVQIVSKCENNKDSDISLLPLTPELHGELARVGNHPEIWRFALNPSVSLSTMHAYLGRVQTQISTGQTLAYVIWHQQREQAIGLSRLKSLDYLNGEAETGTWIHPDFHGKGFNQSVKSQALAMAFKGVRLGRVYCYVHEDNVASIKSLQRFGFCASPSKDRNVLDVQHRLIRQHYYEYTRAMWEQQFGAD